MYGGVLLCERVDVGYVPGVSARKVQLVGVERVRELQRGSVRGHDGTVNGWVHAWVRRGSVRERDGTVGVVVQRRVSSGVLLSRGVEQRHGGGVSRREVQLERRECVCGV